MNDQRSLPSLEVSRNAVIGAEPARAYKKLPECYLRNAELLALEPAQCLLVAARRIGPDVRWLALRQRRLRLVWRAG